MSSVLQAIVPYLSPAKLGHGEKTGLYPISLCRVICEVTRYRAKCEFIGCEWVAHLTCSDAVPELRNVYTNLCFQHTHPVAVTVSGVHSHGTNQRIVTDDKYLQIYFLALVCIFEKLVEFTDTTTSTASSLALQMLATNPLTRICLDVEHIKDFLEFRRYDIRDGQQIASMIRATQWFTTFWTHWSSDLAPCLKYGFYHSRSTPASPLQDCGHRFACMQAACLSTFEQGSVVWFNQVCCFLYLNPDVSVAATVKAVSEDGLCQSQQQNVNKTVLSRCFHYYIKQRAFVDCKAEICTTEHLETIAKSFMLQALSDYPLIASYSDFMKTFLNSIVNELVKKATPQVVESWNDLGEKIMNEIMSGVLSHVRSFSHSSDSLRKKIVSMLADSDIDCCWPLLYVGMICFPDKDREALCEIVSAFDPMASQIAQPFKPSRNLYHCQLLMRFKLSDAAPRPLDYWLRQFGESDSDRMEYCYRSQQVESDYFLPQVVASDEAWWSKSLLRPLFRVMDCSFGTLEHSAQAPFPTRLQRVARLTSLDVPDLFDVIENGEILQMSRNEFIAGNRNAVEVITRTLFDRDSNIELNEWRVVLNRILSFNPCWIPSEITSICSKGGFCTEMIWEEKHQVLLCLTERLVLYLAPPEVAVALGFSQAVRRKSKSDLDIPGLLLNVELIAGDAIIIPKLIQKPVSFLSVCYTYTCPRVFDSNKYANFGPKLADIIRSSVAPGVGPKLAAEALSSILSQISR